ncbi:hypothetical protein OY671_013106, partial [Metschnikowia pulcherrima]
PLRQGRRRHRQAVPRHSPGRKDRAGRPVRGGQVDARQPAPAVLRSGERPYHHRWPGYRQGEAGLAARAYRHDHAGYLAAAPLHPRQRAVWQARCFGRADGPGRAECAGGGVHRGGVRSQGTARVRCACGRAGRQALGRPAPAY